MLRFEDVETRAGSFALRANFRIETPGRVAVLGPSGSGKSTLLALIAGFQTVHSGRVHLLGQDMTRTVPGQRPVSILFQDNNLFPHLTIAANLALALRPSGGRLTSDQQAQIETALTRTGLTGLGARRPAEVSGGQQSRAALARVLLQNRPILLLDEPFAALGPALKDEMLDLVAQLTDGPDQLTLLVSHDPEDARRFAQTSIFVAEGQAHAPQDTQRLFETPPSALRAYLGQRR